MKISLRNTLLVLAVVIVLAVGGLAAYVAKDRIQPVASTPGMVNGVLSLEMPAASITKLAVSAGPGEMKVTPSTDGKVHVQLDLRQRERSVLWLFNWLSGETARDVKGAMLKVDRHGYAPSVSLVYPSGDSHSDVQEKWIISVPAKLMVDVEMQAGRAVIDGMQGGIKLHLTAGEAVIHAAGGPVQASVTYGRLHVISDTVKPGIMTLESKHGLAVLSWDGKYYGLVQEHGFMSSVHLVGNRVVERGPGPDNMDLSVYAGEVDLRVGAMGDFKDYRDLFTDN
ncbi:MAG TPA: hypothetical protein VGO35_08295 [Gammaproteobacteria bacterium]|jgi:hypothetical protein|nr:hypothetical protein [Gammaproteobacteria bacterium]